MKAIQPWCEHVVQIVVLLGMTVSVWAQQGEPADAPPPPEDAVFLGPPGGPDDFAPPNDGPAFMELPEGGPAFLPVQGLEVPGGPGAFFSAPGALPGGRPGEERRAEGSGSRGTTSGVTGNLSRLRERVAMAQAGSVVAGATAASLNGEGDIRLNFKDAPLSQVLNYLSEAAGFVIVQEKEIAGTVSITSHQPITRDEAVDLLNAVLVEKGYAAVRSGRILKVVSRSQALTMDLPVRAGSDPQQIPKKDELVTQIIPVRYADAAKLMENIRPLLEADAALTANESSNAIVLTDTLTNIRRIAEIIRALDTSIASISVVRVFPLEFADAAEVAEVIKEVFGSSSSANSARGNFQRMMEERFRAAGRGGAATASGTSEARQASSRVVAVADQYTNSLVVSAPDEVMPTIEEIVAQLDSNIADVTEVRVFRMEHADAVELASMINELYYDTTSSSGTSRTGARGGPGAFFARGAAQGGSGERSQRSLLQSRVMAVGDPRTNSLIVSAARETMMTIAEMIGRLDASSDKKQRVFVMPLEHADVDNVADVLRGMFETGTTSGSGTRRTTTGTSTGSRLTQRQTQGATSADATFNNSRGTGGGTGGR